MEASADLGCLNITKDIGTLEIWKVDETKEPIYEGMDCIKINFLDADEFDFWSDIIFGCGATPTFEYSTIDLSVNGVPLDTFGIEVYSVIESSNLIKMHIILYGYFLDGDEE